MRLLGDDNSQINIILRGQKVLKVDKYDYTEHPESRKLISRKATEHIPEWHSQLKEDEPDFLYLKKQLKAGSKPKQVNAPDESIPLSSGESIPTPDETPVTESQIIKLDKNSIMS